MTTHPAVTNTDFSWRDVRPRRLHGQADLPPGQRLIRAFPRFADNPLVAPPPLSAEVEIHVKGAVANPMTIGGPDLAEVARVQRSTDFHCVTTWSLIGLCWSGWPLARLWHDVITPNCRPDPDARWLVATGHDSYRARLHLDDALADDVLIVDTLEDRPLDRTHGAPLRLISPHQYAYKSVKHLNTLEVHVEEPPSTLGAKEHPRARVDLQERHTRFPAWLVRWPYRLIVAPTAMVAKRSDPYTTSRDRSRPPGGSTVSS